MFKVNHISPIDTHVHLRWGEGDGAYMRFMPLIFKHAKAVNLAAIIAQGNTDPPLTWWPAIYGYLERMKEYQGDIEVGIHGVLTPDKNQQLHMMGLVQSPEIPVVSAKIFYVTSTNSGRIEIVYQGDQRTSWLIGRDHNFHINRTGHFEAGDLFRDVYDPTKPKTHSLAQPPEAEPAQVERQLRNAYDAGFRGNFIVFHTSNPETIKVVKDFERKFNPDFNTYFEVTHHHLLLNADQDYAIHGNEVKVNPPLRPKEMQEELFEATLRGDVHMIGSDCAPHPRERKIGEKPASGIYNIPAYPLLIKKLQDERINSELLDDLLFHNANTIYFGEKVKPSRVETEYQPGLWERYGVNAFSRVDGTLKTA